MTTVTIFQNSEQIDLIRIKKEFYIVEKSDGELYWYERVENSPYKTGVLEIWLQSVAYDPRILYVSADWQIIIDDLWMEKKFYSELENLQGKKVELRYKNFGFVFNFD